MDNFENTENYTAKDFGKDVAIEVTKTAATVAAGIGVWMAASYAASKVVEFRNARAAKKAENE